MKKVVSILTAVLVFFSILSLPVAAAGSTTLSLSASSTTIRIGDTITVTGNLNATELIGAFDVTVTYNASQLQYTSAAGISPAIKSGELDIVPANGSVQLIYLNADGGLTGIKSANAFKVVFKVIGGSVSDSVSVDVQVKRVGNANYEGMTASVNKASMTIAAPLSGNTDLSNLTVSNATISPTFSKSVTDYTASVPFDVQKLSISATPEDSTSTVSVNSPALTANATTAATVTVTAQSGAKKTYTIRVTRAQDPNYQSSSNNNLSGITVNPGILSPVFKTDITSYVVWLPYEVENITVAGTATDSKASVAVEGGSNLVAGEDNAISVICTAESGTKKTYTVIAKRAAGDSDASDSTDNTHSVDTNSIIKNITAAGQSETEQTVLADLSKSSTQQLDASVFNTLAENKNALLNIKLGGAQITFKGENVETQNGELTYDFTYTQGGEDQDVMIQAAGDESSAFTYSFAYHGNLPGYATFDIDTDFTSGKYVNVYKYDPETQTYTLIAENIKVSAGGVVSYINNTCSEYVITTNVIANATKSNTVSMQVVPKANPDYTMVIIIGIVMLGMGIVIGFFIKTILQNRTYKKNSQDLYRI